MLIEAPKRLNHPIACSICGEATDLPFWQFIGDVAAGRPLCAEDARWISETIWNEAAAVLEAVMIIRQHQRQIGGVR